MSTRRERKVVTVLFCDLVGFTSQAEGRLRAGEKLFATGRHADAVEPVEQALAFYRPVGATVFIERGEALLTDAQTDSA